MFVKIHISRCREKSLLKYILVDVGRKVCRCREKSWLKYILVDVGRKVC